MADKVEEPESAPQEEEPKEAAVEEMHPPVEEEKVESVKEVEPVKEEHVEDKAE